MARLKKGAPTPKDAENYRHPTADPTFRTSRARYQVGAVKVSAGSFMS